MIVCTKTFKRITINYLLKQCTAKHAKRIHMWFTSNNVGNKLFERMLINLFQGSLIPCGVERTTQ